MKQIFLFALISILFLFCAPQKESTSSESKQISIEDGWVRPSKAGMMTAAYFNIHNGTANADTLQQVSTTITPNTQIHKSYQNDAGLMAMEEQDFVAIPAESMVEFKQGGLHIMIIQPEVELAEGDSLSLVLSFSSSQQLEISLPVRAYK